MNTIDHGWNGGKLVRGDNRVKHAASYHVLTPDNRSTEKTGRPTALLHRAKLQFAKHAAPLGTADVTVEALN